jgi:hypothetical protein
MRRLRRWIEGLAGGQVAVLAIIGLLLSYWAWTEIDWDWFRVSLGFSAVAFVCAAGTAFLAFTWFGRRRND